MTIKAIVLDIDGTLLNTGKIISEKTKQALIAAQEEGIKVILALQSGHEYRNGPSNSRTLEKFRCHTDD